MPALQSRLRVLLAACAVGGISLFGPRTSCASAVSLARADSTFLQSFLAARQEEPVDGARFVVEEDQQSQPREAVQECRERRNFRLLRALDPKLSPAGSTPWSEYARYSILLCQHGPLSTAAFQSTIDTALQTFIPPGKPVPLELQDYVGFPVRIGDRTGRAVVLVGIGHGIIPAPLAIIASGDERSTLMVVCDDDRLGEPGHEVKRTLTKLADLLKTVDALSRGGPHH
jgi:hypothetical protein